MIHTTNLLNSTHAKRISQQLADQRRLSHQPLINIASFHEGQLSLPSLTRGGRPADNFQNYKFSSMSTSSLGRTDAEAISRRTNSIHKTIPQRLPTEPLYFVTSSSPDLHSLTATGAAIARPSDSHLATRPEISQANLLTRTSKSGIQLPAIPPKPEGSSKHTAAPDPDLRLLEQGKKTPTESRGSQTLAAQLDVSKSVMALEIRPRLKPTKVESSTQTGASTANSSPSELGERQAPCPAQTIAIEYVEKVSLPAHPAPPAPPAPDMRACPTNSQSLNDQNLKDLPRASDLEEQVEARKAKSGEGTGLEQAAPSLKKQPSPGPHQAKQAPSQVAIQDQARHSSLAEHPSVQGTFTTADNRKFTRIPSNQDQVQAQTPELIAPSKDKASDAVEADLKPAEPSPEPGALRFPRLSLTSQTPKPSAKVSILESRSQPKLNLKNSLIGSGEGGVKAAQAKIKDLMYKRFRQLLKKDSAQLQESIRQCASKEEKLKAYDEQIRKNYIYNFLPEELKEPSIEGFAEIIASVNKVRDEDEVDNLRKPLEARKIPELLTKKITIESSDLAGKLKESESLLKCLDKDEPPVEEAVSKRGGEAAEAVPSCFQGLKPPEHEKVVLRLQKRVKFQSQMLEAFKKRL